MDIGDGHKHDKQCTGMLINDLLYMLTAAWIMDKAVFINKHHGRLKCGAS